MITDQPPHQVLEFALVRAVDGARPQRQQRLAGHQLRVALRSRLAPHGAVRALAVRSPDDEPTIVSPDSLRPSRANNERFSASAASRMAAIVRPTCDSLRNTRVPSDQGLKR